MIPLAGEGSGPLGPLLPAHISEFVVGLVLFGVIWFVVAKMVVPRFEKIYAQREDAIRGGIDRAEKAQAEAAKAKASYEAQLADVHGEAAKIRDDAKATATQIEADARTKAEAEAARIMAGAQAQIDAERSRVVAELTNDLGGLATTLAGKVVGEAMTDDERAQRTIDNFLADLEKSGAAGTTARRNA
jgi:F-type H+-transporting ATPase subunit b